MTQSISPLILYLFLAQLYFIPQHMQAPEAHGELPAPVVVRGRVVCVASNGTVIDGPGNCDIKYGSYGLLTSDSAAFRFISSDSQAKMLGDPRVRERELQISAWLKSDGTLEIVKIYSIREGKLHDIYYFCDVCTVTAYAPGLCPCCREEFELMETPVLEP